MKRYIERNAFTKKPVFWLPHVITRAQPPVDNSANLVLTIPGAIDHKRRDYLFALDVFETLHSLHPSTRLILAGRPVGEYGNTILSKCKGLQQEGKSILFFNHEIKETTFQSLLSESTFLFSPLQVSTTIHDDIPEQYGVSKYSGNIYDAIRHGKILLVPATLSVPKEMESSTVFYHAKEHFITRLLELVSDKEKLFQLQNEAYQNAMNFTKADYAHRFNALLHLAPR
ncbi:MAG: hypothetical protein M3Q06_03815 [Bacteroidota bacterium]|nr:hypothetical protein [Bacteroidota bacterium]